MDYRENKEETKEKKFVNNKYFIPETIITAVDVILCIVALFSNDNIIQSIALFFIIIIGLIILYNIVLIRIEERAKKDDIFGIEYDKKLNEYERYKNGKDEKIKTFFDWKKSIKKDIEEKLQDDVQYEEFKRWIIQKKKNAAISKQMTFGLSIPFLIMVLSVIVPIINGMDVFEEIQRNNLFGENSDLIVLGVIMGYILFAGLIILTSSRDRIKSQDLVESFVADLLVAIREIKKSETQIIEEEPATTSSNDISIKYVYIPKNGGEKYHKVPSCGSMKSSKKVTLEQAQKERYTECKRCAGH